jgi:4-amino-4-deoxy-L-arabinose transferase-like glycosyltransferase
VNIPAEMNRTCKLIFLAVFIFLACFFSFVARHRFIDGDEGYYLLASRLVLERKAPYLNFLYSQAPLLPYVYGFWMKLFGISWFSARYFSAALTTVLGLLICEHVWSQTQKWIASVAAVVLFASSTLIFAWFPIAKTYSLAGLFLFGAYAIVTRLSPASSPWLVAAAGLLFGLSVDTRSYVVGLAPIFLSWIFRPRETRNGTARILLFLGGFMIGILPCLYFFVASPDLFLFNNLGLRAMISNARLIGDWRQKFHEARVVMFGAEDNGIQFSILSVVSFSSILSLRMRRSGALFAFLNAFVLGFISILPTPTFVQYYCMCMPFLIVAAVCGTSDCITSLHGRRIKRTAVLASVVVMVAFVASSVPSFRRYLFTGDRVIGLQGTRDAPNWTLDRVSAVSEAIDQLAAPNEQVASFWPGYVFASKAVPYPGFENDFGWIVTDELTSERRAKYHLVARSDIEADFAAHTPRIVVLGNQENGGSASWASATARLLRADDYTAVRTIGDASIFLCCSSAMIRKADRRHSVPK